jgi:3-methylcrotonyl-CoA carboxylase alpha subunit
VSSLRQPLREQLWAHAVALGHSARYLGLGTVEFAVTGETAVFLEINPRLQVEHPVTEAVTGLDLVALQIQTVAEKRLPFAQRDLAPAQGVAVQARLYAEDAAQGFMPSTGTVEVFEAAPVVRTDAGVATGSTITAHYDPMIAKLIAHAADRPRALGQLREALAKTTVLGVTSNRAFLMALLADPAVAGNAVNTEFIDAWLAARGQPAEPAEHVAAAMALWLAGQRALAGVNDAGAWFDARLTGWRIRRTSLALTETWQAATASGAWRVGLGACAGAGRFEVQVDGKMYQVEAADAASSDWQSVSVDGRVLRLRAHVAARAVSALIGDEQLALDIQPMHTDSAGAGAAGQGLVRAPMMGLVIGVDAAVGTTVALGQRLATMESMKMEMAINAPLAGTVSWVGCAAQARVERHQDLFHITPQAPAAPQTA